MKIEPWQLALIAAHFVALGLTTEDALEKAFALFLDACEYLEESPKVRKKPQR